jgi:hypothetical protein
MGQNDNLGDRSRKRNYKADYNYFKRVSLPLNPILRTPPILHHHIARAVSSVILPFLALPVLTEAKAAPETVAVAVVAMRAAVEFPM